MAKKLSDVDDGYLRGIIEVKGGECYACGRMTRVIFVRSLTLPKGFEDFETQRLIFCDSTGTQLDRVGIGCGCYAKGHRQIAHILDSFKTKWRQPVAHASK